MNKKNKIMIIGAGLCGSLLAIRLGQRGYDVELLEKRPDPRDKSNVIANRTINLTLSHRGNKGLKLVNLKEKVENLSVPLDGRMIHDNLGNVFLSQYSGREKEYLYSVSRRELNELLIDEADKLKNVSIKFNIKCSKVDFENSRASFYSYKTKENFTLDSDIIIGTDGAGSILRKSYFLEKKFLFSFSQDYLTHGYKELTISASENESYNIYKNALHVWPRGDFMLVALPNLDGTFTATLFLSYKNGEYNFNNLTNASMVKKFFKKEFPDALKIMPTLVDDFFKNPTAPLGTIKCTPWNYKGKTLLMGDSAHAIVPFYGQGMNACFEDVVEFDKILDQNLNSWEKVFEIFEINRKKHTDAISFLAIDNFYEIRDHLNSPIFKKKRKIELMLEKEFPKEYFSKYSLVTFNKKVGYHEAMVLGRAQDKAILNLIVDEKICDSNDDSREVLDRIKKEMVEVLNKDYIAQNANN